MGTETGKVFAELIDELRALEQRILSGPNTPLDDQGLLEGYKWIFSILAVGIDAYVWADPGRPRFVDIVGPYRKWGGDNADAFYQYAPIDPARTYHVRGRKGDAVYFSLTVYGGPNDGRYSDRIVGTVNHRMLAGPEGGTFQLLLSPQPPQGAGLKPEPDAGGANPRDHLAGPVSGRRLARPIE